MLLNEANSRLNEKITEEQLQQLNNLYAMLNLDKDDFCAIVNLLGMEKVTEQASRYARMMQCWWDSGRHGNPGSASKVSKAVHDLGGCDATAVFGTLEAPE